MNALDVSRWQFGITTVYHFILVPLTIGLAPLIAIMQTAWVVTGNNSWYRLTKFFGKLFLINFALGVATGIVQEFQFGMNWSEYSRFVGDVFGAPGAGRPGGLLPRIDFSGLVDIWMDSPAQTGASGLYLDGGHRGQRVRLLHHRRQLLHAAPCWCRIQPQTGRAELTSITELLTNNTALAAFPHTVAGSLLTAGTFIAGICGWWMVRSHRVGTLDDARTMYRPAAIGACAVMILSGVALAATGDVQGKLMFQQQPMKMASAESLCYTEKDPKFSVLTVGTHNNCASVTHAISLPYVLPFLAEGKFTDVTLKGVEDLQRSMSRSSVRVTIGPICL